ncbi:MAG: hypothetical protein GPOALKHO_001029 [Sodalis sp.]|nr:MAG: hypothetical protein GPOALKHO_001029 [Sodalis sp.]
MLTTTVPCQQQRPRRLHRVPSCNGAGTPLAQAVSRRRRIRCSAGVTHASRDLGNGDHESLFHPRIGLLLLL